MNIKKLLNELKRRKVYHVAITYGITAWLLAQILSLVSDTFKAPDWVMQMALVLLIIGFPVAIILAWAYELSPNGIISSTKVNSEENPFPSSKRRPMLPILLLGLITIGVSIFLFSSSETFKTPDEQNQVNFSVPNSIPIAMLPLINLSEDKQLGYFSNQVTNDIINELAKVRPFAVTAFSTIYGYQDKGKSPKDIAAELDVAYLMRGSARAFADGDSIKIAIELVNPTTGRLLWGETYQELMDEAPALQSAIARKVAASLNVQLSDSESESLMTDRTDNGDAYLKFLEAREGVQTMRNKGMSKAVNLLTEAIELDPDFAEAHTLLAWVLTMYSWPAFKTDEATLEKNKERIEKHLNRSIELNPASSDVYLVQANYIMSYKDDLKKSLQLVEKALELNSWPELPTTLCVCTAVTVNVIAGRLDRAKELTNIAREVEPGNIMILNDAFYIHLAENNIDEATKNMERALQLINVPVFRYQTGWAYFHQGRYKEAINMLENAYDGEGYTPASNTAYLSNAYYKLGDLKSSNYYKNILVNLLSEGEKNVLVDLASIAAVRGEDAQALAYLEQHQQEAVIGISFQLSVDPVFNKYHEDPRFIALRNHMGYYN